MVLGAFTAGHHTDQIIEHIAAFDSSLPKPYATQKLDKDKIMPT